MTQKHSLFSINQCSLLLSLSLSFSLSLWLSLLLSIFLSVFFYLSFSLSVSASVFFSVSLILCFCLSLFPVHYPPCLSLSLVSLVHAFPLCLSQPGSLCHSLLSINLISLFLYLSLFLCLRSLFLPHIPVWLSLSLFPSLTLILSFSFSFLLSFSFCLSLSFFVSVSLSLFLPRSFSYSIFSLAHTHSLYLSFFGCLSLSMCLFEYVYCVSGVSFFCHFFFCLSHVLFCRLSLYFSICLFHF